MPWSVQVSTYWTLRWWKGLTGMERQRFVEALLAYGLKMEFLDGYRTYIAGIGFIGLGLYCLSQNDVEKGIAAISAGLGLIGHAGKQDKQVEATKASAVLQLANATEPPTPTPEAGVSEADIDKALATVTSPTLAMTPVPKADGNP
jgi:hypothetical protein